MSNSRLEPAGDFVLVLDSLTETKIGDIDLPENMRQQEMIFGTVVFAGPDAIHTKPEDRVCYGPYAGKMVNFQGVEFRLLRQGQIEIYVRQDE